MNYYIFIICSTTIAWMFFERPMHPHWPTIVNWVALVITKWLQSSSGHFICMGSYEWSTTSSVHPVSQKLKTRDILPFPEYWKTPTTIDHQYYDSMPCRIFFLCIDLQSTRLCYQATNNPWPPGQDHCFSLNLPFAYFAITLKFAHTIFLFQFEQTCNLYYCGILWGAKIRFLLSGRLIRPICRFLKLVN